MNRLLKEYLAYPKLGGGLLRLNRDAMFTEIPYGDDKRQIFLVFYPPEGVPVRRETAVYFYGGGWRFFSPKEFAFAGAWLAERGYVAVMPGYRTVPKARYPVPLDDGVSGYAAALDFLRASGRRADRVIVTGASAGGHTAAMLALHPELWHGAEVLGLCSMSGVLDFTACPEKIMERILRDLFPKRYDRRSANPIAAITGGERFPVLCLHGAEDPVVNVRASERFCEAFQAANGGGAEFFLQAEGAVHHSDFLIGVFAERLAATEKLQVWLEGISK